MLGSPIGFASLHACAPDGISAGGGGQVRKIDRKLRQCRNPLTDPTSDAYRKLAEERQRKAREDQILKVNAAPHLTSCHPSAISPCPSAYLNTSCAVPVSLFRLRGCNIYLSHTPPRALPSMLVTHEREDQ